VEEKKPTCEEPGVKAHYYCENCGKYYDASTGAVGDEITADDLVLEALGHSHGSEWVTDAAGHWHSCSCGDKADYAEHPPETVGAEAPAVGKPGYTGDTVCSVCGYKIAEGEQIPAETTAPATTVPPTTQAPATQPGEEPGNGGAFWWILVILAAAAAAVALACGMTPAQIVRGIEAARTIAGRFRVLKTERMTVIDDCYNANPVSMKSSVAVLSQGEGRRCAILGDMGELGENEIRLHEEVGAYTAGRVDHLIAVGELARHLYDAALKENPGLSASWYESVDAFLLHRDEELREGDSVLVKASHFMQFSRIVEALTAHAV
jgi:hypothetical protein